MNIQKIIDKAKHSTWQLWLLNVGLARVIPFNKPHHIKILSISDDTINTLLPYRRRNLNHIKGLHACGLATLSEFTTGLLLLSKVNPGRYRIILKNLTITYHYQGKMDAKASFTLTDEWLEKNVFKVLSTEDSTLVDCPVDIHDVKGNHISSAKVQWQLKSWDRVRTSL